MDLSVIPPSAMFSDTPEHAAMRVLLVEDEAAQRRILLTLLKRNGFDVVDAEDPAAARVILESRVPLDAILTDLHLGHESGLEVLSVAARTHASASRILMSAQVDVDSVMHAVNGVGVYQVVEKPLNHQHLLSTLDRACSFARMALEREVLQRALQARTKELESINLSLEAQVTRRTSELLSGLLAALDWRDTETQAHSRRVAAYARRLGRQLGLEGEALANVTAGALLHDIGKIGVPDHVLRKRAPLTPEEWNLMQRHPAVGDALLKPIAILQGARRVVLEHHERWDGTGYPSGLRGTGIDLGARIFAVVDAHDAITSDRPHRVGRAIPAARELISLAGGTQFDPEVVAAYQAVPDAEFASIAASYQEQGSWTSIGELLTGLKSG